MNNQETTNEEIQDPQKENTRSREIEITDVDTFNYDGYQVVRGEFFAHIYEPSFTFNSNKVSVNTACIKKLPSVDYVQILVNPDDKHLAVRPCKEDEKDSFRWCSATSKRTPKQITCRVFFAKVIALMGWNPNYRYKLLGKLIRSNDELLFVFDLSTPEIFMRTIKDDGKEKTSRTPTYPEEWKNQFGVPVEDHQNSLQINIFDGYAVFGIHENEKKLSSNSIETNQMQANESEEKNYEQTSLFTTADSIN
jgi:hypothetical protein